MIMILKNLLINGTRKDMDKRFSLINGFMFITLQYEILEIFNPSQKEWSKLWSGVKKTEFALPKYGIYNIALMANDITFAYLPDDTIQYIDMQEFLFAYRRWENKNDRQLVSKR